MKFFFNEDFKTEIEANAWHCSFFFKFNDSKYYILKKHKLFRQLTFCKCNFGFKIELDLKVDPFKICHCGVWTYIVDIENKIFHETWFILNVRIWNKQSWMCHYMLRYSDNKHVQDNVTFIMRDRIGSW